MTPPDAQPAVAVEQGRSIGRAVDAVIRDACRPWQHSLGDPPDWGSPLGHVSIRLAGIQAPDYTSAEPCKQRRAAYTCDDRAAEASRERLAWIVGQRITCEPVGRSYRRVVAWCRVGGRDLSCSQVRAGAAVVWRRYDPEDRLGRCRRG